MKIYCFANALDFHVLKLTHCCSRTALIWLCIVLTHVSGACDSDAIFDAGVRETRWNTSAFCDQPWTAHRFTARLKSQGSLGPSWCVTEHNRHQTWQADRNILSKIALLKSWLSFGGLFSLGIIFLIKFIFFWIPVFLLFLLLCFSASPLFAFLLFLLLCFSASVPFYSYFFFFCSHAFLLLCFSASFSLPSPCFSFSFALFSPFCILNETPEKP